MTANDRTIINPDPRETIDKSPMSLLQIFIIAITVGLNAMDGIDVLSISLAAPDIAREWGLNDTIVGFILSMELIGMGIGSIALGWVADATGRRKTMLVCLLMMALGMFMVTQSANVIELSIYRIITGLGIGGLLASITAITAEFSNLKNRALCISIMAIGYPLGGIVGSKIAGWLLQTYGDWRLIFYFGAFLTLVFVPLFYFVVPETVHWLIRKQPEGALDKVNKTLKSIGHDIVTMLPEITPEVRKKSYSDLFASSLIRITIIISIAYLLQISTYYFILKWVPKVVVKMGFASADGAQMMMFANIGGALGGMLLGLLTLRVSVKRLTVATLIFSAVFITILGTTTDLKYFALFAVLSGFFGNAGIVGMYALFPAAFPTHVRASGTGFVLGIGRGGAYLSPVIVGYMFDHGLSLPAVTMLISIGALVGAGVLMFLKLEK
ncbi:MAG: MFS transporter [Deltaproteobacteria bacterium]|nr:MFS transporter [Deltaproteobacteria bacterium]